MKYVTVFGRKKLSLEDLKKMRKGRWIFTCDMRPKQFLCFVQKSPEDYGKKAFGRHRERFFKYDDFLTIEGSSHSVYHCGLRPISKKYAEWFIKNKCWDLFPSEEFDTKDQWKIYVKRVKKLCKEHKIKFEGI